MRLATASLRPEGYTASAHLEVLGYLVGDNEDEALWTAFLQHLRDWGLAWVQLVISESHASLMKAIAHCFQGCGC